MANIYDTILECETSDTLLNLLDPEKLIVDTNSQFGYSRYNELGFESQSETMHKDIILLSEKFPREVFTAVYFDHELYEETKFHYYRYEDGKSEFLGYIPRYNWENHGPILKAFGDDEFKKLWLRIRKYLFRLDQTRESILDGELRVDILENHYDQCVTSYVTMFAEHENFRLSVEKTKKSNLYFRGYRRDSEFEDWKEIFESQNNNLPF